MSNLYTTMHLAKYKLAKERADQVPFQGTAHENSYWTDLRRRKV